MTRIYNEKTVYSISGKKLGNICEKIILEHDFKNLNKLRLEIMPVKTFIKFIQKKLVERIKNSQKTFEQYGDFPVKKLFMKP